MVSRSVGIVSLSRLDTTDTLQTRFVKAVTGEDIKTTKTGKSTYRTLIEVDELMKDPLVRPLYEDQPSGFLSHAAKNTGIFFMTYPCRHDKQMNFAVFHNTKPHQVDAEDWNSPATVEDCMEVVEHFHPSWKAIVTHAENMVCYTVGRRDILPRFVNGKVVMIGE
jgi:salicylate hydroxylase